MKMQAASRKEIEELLFHLFGDMEKTLQLLSPEGWKNSPLYAVSHPSAAQQMKEELGFNHFTKLILDRMGESVEEDPNFGLTEDQFKELKPGSPTEHDLLCLLGTCITEIMADYCLVITTKRKFYYLGPMERASNYMARFLNRYYPIPDWEFKPFNFFHASGEAEGRADIMPIWTLLFQRLKERGLDWVYSLPKGDFSELIDEWRTAIKSYDPPPQDMDAYDPAHDMEMEMEREHVLKTIDYVEEVANEMLEKELEVYAYDPPFMIRGYHAVFGDWPTGFVKKE